MSKTVRVRTTPNGKDAYLKVKVVEYFINATKFCCYIE